MIEIPSPMCWKQGGIEETALKWIDKSKTSNSSVKDGIYTVFKARYTDLEQPYIRDKNWRNIEDDTSRIRQSLAKSYKQEMTSQVILYSAAFILCYLP